MPPQLPQTASPAATGDAPADLRPEHDLRLVRDALLKYGIVFLHRPDVTGTELRWLLGGPMLFGYAPGELKPGWRSFATLIHPRDALLVVQPRDAEAFSDKAHSPLASEYRIRHKNGEYIRIRSIMTPFPPEAEGAGPASVEMIRIIDERLSYERAATNLSEDALSTVLNQIGYPVILMNRTGLIVQANDAAEQLCGATDVAERFCPFLHHADGTMLFPGFLEQVIHHGQSAQKEFYRFDRWWHVHLVPIHDSDRAVARILLLAQDITALKAASERRIQQERALTETLTREIHHRIKNHLQGLVGLIRLHEGSGNGNATLINSVVTQIQSIAAMHGLLARSGQTTVKLRSLIEEIVSAHRSATPIPIRFVSNLPPNFSLELRENEAVPVAVAINELITNAAKHTSQVASADILLTLTEHSAGHVLTITNAPARLPDDFRSPDWLSQQSGLALVLTLLSGSRFRVTFAQNGESVSAHLAF